MVKKRRKKRNKAKNPWDLRRTLAVSLAAHGFLLIALIALGWWHFSIIKPGSAIFVTDVAIGDGEGGQAQTQVRSRSPIHRGESDGKPSPKADPSLAVESASNASGGDASRTGTGNSPGGVGAGSGTGGAGDPVLAEIRRRIEQAKRYPSQAREQHIEGKVGVRFLIQSNGQVADVKVTRSSGTSVLDAAAVQAVQHSAPLPFYEHPIDLSLAFRLR